MTLTMFEQFRQEGLQQGFIKGQRRMVLAQAEAKFGPLSPEVRQRIEAVPSDKLEELAIVLLKAGSLRELGLE